MKLNPKWHGEQLRSGNGILGVIDNDKILSRALPYYTGSAIDFQKLFQGDLIWSPNSNRQDLEFLSINGLNIGSIQIGRRTMELSDHGSRNIKHYSAAISASLCDDKFWKMNDTIEEAKRALEEHFGVVK